MTEENKDSNDHDGDAAPLVHITPKPAKALAKVAMGAAAALQDPAELAANIVKRREALLALLEDDSVSEKTKTAIQAIAAQASPDRPGLEEMTALWKVATVNIVQPTTQSDAKPPDARPGDLYTTSGQHLERPWGAIPIYFFESNVNFPSGAKIPACSAPDAKLGSPFGECLKCIHLPFGKQNGGRGDQKKTDCQNSINVVMLAIDLSAVYTVQFSKTSRRAGSALLSLAGQQTAVWKQSYLLSTEKKTGDLGLYYIFKTEPTGKDNAPDVQKFCEALYGMFIANRKFSLADWYARPSRAPEAAIEAEGQFGGGALEQGLGDGGDTGVEADFTTAVKSQQEIAKAVKGSNAKHSAKPM